MQPAYGGYQPYTAQAPYPGQYYANAGYTNGYPNANTYSEPAASYQPWQNTPQMSSQMPPVNGQTPMARPQQLWDASTPQRQASNGGNTPMPRPKTLNTKTKPPLRSAMKKPSRSVSEPMYGRRARTNSDPHGALGQFSRARTNSVTARDIPDHMFLSIVGTSELRIQNIKPPVLEEIKRMIGTMWHPGIEAESMGPNHVWHVKLANTPWSSVGTDAIMVLRMINQWFNRITLYYDFGTTVNAGLNPPPRLMFVQSKDPGIWINHFVGYISRTGRKLTLIDPPPSVGENIGARLRTAWPHKVELTDRPPDGGVYTVSLRGTYGSYDQQLFTSYALQEIRALGFKLLATIPLAKRGSFGLGSRREVLVFQDMTITPARRPTQ